jgi:hypothetical protein
VYFLSPFRKTSGCYLYQVMMASFQILFNSSTALSSKLYTLHTDSVIKQTKQPEENIIQTFELLVYRRHLPWCPFIADSDRKTFRIKHLNSIEFCFEIFRDVTSYILEKVSGELAAPSSTLLLCSDTSVACKRLLFSKLQNTLTKL